MKLTRIDVRFFKSFNFDYELKAKEDQENRVPPTWELSDGKWYPFVRVPLDEEITAIVGANESGKSQLLTAIEAALTGNPIKREDFCRYSDLYSVKQGEIRLPEFGAWFRVDSDEARPAIPALQSASEFALYRPGNAAPFLVVEGQRVAVTPEHLAELAPALPSFHTLRTDLAIPDSVSIARLAGRNLSPFPRRERVSILTTLFGSEKTEAGLGKALLPFLSTSSSPDAGKSDAEFELARKLLVDAARIDQRAFGELLDAIADGREGQVEGLVDKMNAAIKENLNVQRWWTQDKDFDLLVEAREHELAFTIKDRTASTYSFKERSQGLRFFLSYFVQLTAHRLRNQKPDILLLDEPDAYLSSVGQQDLLRVLHDYAFPEDGSPRSQVVYVTHSPFLIDKNAGYRIRVLDKGSEDEGTRVVRDAANNRYEPLRSSLGTYVAETAFIGGQNLFVEGPGDQILLAGMSSHLARRNGSTAGVLDLNAVTVVACGGADAIPYMVYLARGRDTVKPACVALLDSDKAGKDAAKVLRRGEARKKRVLQDRFIVTLADWAQNSGLFRDGDVEEIEDLVPIPLARRAALNYIARFVDLSGTRAGAFSVELITAEVSRANGRIWQGLTAALRVAFPEEHLEKAGFAREVVELLTMNADVEGASDIRERFASLLGLLSETLLDADEDESHERSDDRLQRAVRTFLRDYPKGMRKFEASRTLRTINTALSQADHADDIRAIVARLEREYELSDLSNPNVPRFEQFRDEIKALISLDRVLYQDDSDVDPSAAFTVQEPTQIAPVSDVSVPPRSSLDSPGPSAAVESDLVT
ncbi:hypothetical protein ABCS02_17200 [Microbacterium sp. X-17]|uniref:ATP-dependent nuclease n=1 Tax=Microbacterium sp. X-17 TaxID=3144404 RepID=UPI0031F4AAFD